MPLHILLNREVKKTAFRGTNLREKSDNEGTMRVLSMYVELLFRRRWNCIVAHDFEFRIWKIS